MNSINHKLTIKTLEIYLSQYKDILDKTTDLEEIIPIIIAIKLFNRGIDKIIIF